jgi:hypothetical protein
MISLLSRGWLMLGFMAFMPPDEAVDNLRKWWVLVSTMTLGAGGVDD